MKVKAFSLFIGLLLISIDTLGQQLSKDTLNLCSRIIELKSYYWKLDSLGANGYRLCSSDEILKCQLDKIKLDDLLKYFGKPNKVEKSSQGVEYIYYYFDYRRLPKEVNSVAAIYFIGFFFKDDSKYVNEITSGYYE
jgi:hypothetical protein